MEIEPNPTESHPISEQIEPSKPTVPEASREPSLSGDNTGENDPITLGSDLQRDLQINYTDHLKRLESASMAMLDGVVTSARRGFNLSLFLNTLTFILGVSIVIIGLVILLRSPETIGRVIGTISALLGIILVISLLFWRGPLDRILASVSNLAQINAISLGLTHRLNQISRVFVQRSLSGGVDIVTLELLNKLVDKSVQESVQELMKVLPKESAEAQVQKFLSRQAKK